jgi:aminoglycoside phosphotransferase (APT) family kinase protein
MTKDSLDDANEVVGFDTAVIETWLQTVTDVEMPVRWERLPGGHSNLTSLLTDAAGRELVIRRPPQGELIPKAHDMWREYRVIDGLWPTAVPVAEPIAYCDDRAVAETHFYVMGKVEGQALYSGAEVADWLTGPARRRAGESFIDVLAALHMVDPAAVGLDDLGRHDGYAARQLKTWHASWMSSIPASGLDDPRIHELHDWLSTSIPEQGPARVVHGDYGPHNSLFSRDGALTAVLDWEIATLGEPIADLAYTINAWAEPADFPGGSDAPTALPGFPSRSELIARYGATTGADLTHLDYFRALNWWKTGCILHGVYARYVAGQKSSEGVDLPGMVARMNAAIDQAAVYADQIRAV